MAQAGSYHIVFAILKPLNYRILTILKQMPTSDPMSLPHSVCPVCVLFIAQPPAALVDIGRHCLIVKCPLCGSDLKAPDAKADTKPTEQKTPDDTKPAKQPTEQKTPADTKPTKPTEQKTPKDTEKQPTEQKTPDDTKPAKEPTNT